MGCFSGGLELLLLLVGAVFVTKCSKSKSSISGGLILLAIAFLASTTAVLGAPDNRGKEFVIGFMENEIYRSSYQCELFITTASTTKVSVKVDSPKCSSPKISDSFSITAGQVKQLFLHSKIRMYGSAKGNKGILVTASDEIVVYGINKEPYSNDGFVGLPTDVLSDEYYVVSWYPPSMQCQLMVVGVEDSTKVTVTLGQYMGSKYVTYNKKNYKKGNSISENLNKYDTWQLVSTGDMSGSKVTSNKRISIFSGNKRTNIGKGTSRDHLVEHMTPVNTWGKTFATVPIPKRTVGDYFKFIASEANTKVKISGGYSSSFTISKAGGVVQKLISSKAYCRVVADKPIMLVQFVQSQQSSSEESDPAMMIIPPCEQYAADYTFSTPKYSKGSYENYFMFIVEAKEKSGLRINGKAFSSNTKFNPISGTTLVGGYISIPEGTHTVRHMSPIAIFGGFLYGRASYETYGFTTGMRMAKVNAICVPTPTVTGDGIDNDCDGKIDEELCSPENKNKDDDGDGKVNEDCAKPLPIDGNWASWTSYGACSVTCKPTSRTATGTKTRTRTCSNPAPAYDGKQCAGSGTQTSSCSATNPCKVQRCYTCSNGKKNSDCTKIETCKHDEDTCETKIRRDKGEIRKKCEKAKDCKPKCDAKDKECTMCCKGDLCNKDQGYAEFKTWGQWSPCSKQCGGGKRSRSRQCSNTGNRPCSGDTKEEQDCNKNACVQRCYTCSYGKKNSDCTKIETCKNDEESCETKVKRDKAEIKMKCRKTKDCKPKCVGNDNECTMCCTGDLCNKGQGYAEFKTWGQWSSCSKQCGGGKRSRSRLCSNTDNRPCSGDTKEEQDCNKNACAPNSVPSRNVYSGAPDNRGKEFIIGFMENEIYRSSYQCELFITTASTTKVSVKVDSPKCSNPKISASFSITAGQVKQLFLNSKIRMYGSAKGNKGILVTASDEIVVYGINKEHYSNDGFVGLPTDVLSDEYYVVSWYPPSKQCQLMVVGVEDSTKVTVTLGQYMGSKYVTYNKKNYKKGNSISENLNKYDTWQLDSTGDLSGSKVTSNKRISVFSGNMRTNIGKGTSRDHLVEHMTPVNTWGKNFATVPIPKRTVGDYFKFIASEANTKVKISGGYSSSFTISKAGDVVQKLISSKAYCRVVADKPIMLVQFVQSQQSSSEESDPAMMIIPPCEQYAADYTFSTPKYSKGSYENYFMFIVEEKEKSGLRINGKAFSSNTKFNQISGTTLVGGFISIPEGTHTVRHTSPIAIFGGFLYGRANYETYGFTTGMRMAQVNAICVPTPTVTGDGIDNDCDGKIDEELCTPENKNKDDDGDGKVNEDCAKPLPIDGNWASWTSYGACSVTCKPTSRTATGTKTRTRTCSNPAPANGGKQCAGSGTQTSSCSATNPCKVQRCYTCSYGKKNSDCTKIETCKQDEETCETKIRRDKGEISKKCEKTKDCKPKCDPKDKECIMCCTGDLCNKDQGYAEFKAWGQWSSCSKQCGGGKRSRSRQCSNTGNRPCSGDTKEEQDCNKNACVQRCYTCSHGKKNSDCTKIETCKKDEDTCETKIRRDKGEIRKKCEKAKDCKPNCDAKDKECTMCCIGDLCNKDHGYAEFKTWGQWSSCSKQCGGGKRSRSRECSNTGNLPCSGDTKEEQDCNKNACVQRCYTCSYGKKNSDCTKIETCKKDEESCETKVKRDKAEIKMKCRKTKDCKPKCVAHEKECTMCCTGDLCNKGQGYAEFKTWEQWSSCSKQCGGGKRSRSRQCSNTGNRPCSGDTKEEQDCNKNACAPNSVPNKNVYSGAPDNRGKEFVIGFMENYIYQSSYQCELFITTASTTKVSVKVDSPKCSNPKISASFSITAGQVKQLFLHSKIRMYGSAKGNKGVLVTASDEIVVYGINKEANSNDGFMGLPTDVLSDEYYVVSWYPPYRHCQLMVVGVEDSTKVTVTLGQYMGSKYVTYNRKNYKKGDSISENLNKYDTWQLISTGDLSGSKITSNKRISVFSGNMKTNIGKGNSQDHLVEHITPVNTWGKKFATVPIPKRTVGDYFKFIASEANTKVKITGGYSSSFTISKAGGVVQKLISSKAYCRVVADKPIMLVQFVQSQQSSSETSDPAMMIIPPCEQYAADYTFTTPKYTQGSYENYFMFIVEEKEKSGLRINGKAFSSNTKFNPISGTTLVGGYISIPEGTHTVRHTSPIAIFGGFLYGKAPLETYGFTTGMRMAQVNAICVPTPTVTGDGIDNDCDGKIDEELCTPENKNKDDDGDGKVNEDCAKPPPIDGNWASWNSYGACSVTCKPTSRTATGTKTRTRTCSNPAPAYDGKQCAGSGTQTSSCSATNPCKVQRCYTCSYGKKNSDCTKIETCKQDEESCETKVKRDKAEIKMTCRKTKDCKPKCVAHEKECTMCCTGDLCNKGQGYAEFKTWGQWSSCSKHCGGGKRSRSRECSNTGNRPCSGDTKEEQDCNKNACQTNVCVKDCKGVKNGDYQSCSTCNGFIKCSNHRLYNFKCPGSTVWDDKVKRCEWKSTTCNSQPALMRCYTCSYGKKNSDCTKIETCKQDEDTCETKIHRDKAEIRKKCEKAKDCKPKCDAKDKECTMCCKGDLCNKDQGYAEFKSWGQWSSCSKQCGGGKRSRSRECSNTGNLPCSGDTKEEQDCNKQACAPKVQRCYTCSYGKKNSDCTKIETCKQDEESCETKVKRDKAEIKMSCRKTKDCKPKCVAHEKECTMCCTGDLCNKGQGYAEFKTWGQWSSCSKQCGGGKRSRSRECSNTGNRPCSGDTKEEQDCNKNACQTNVCVKDCKGVKNGDYQSCSICNGFIKCSNHRLYNFKCPGSTVWDDKVKRCEWKSTTCNSQPALMRCYTCSYGKKNSDCTKIETCKQDEDTCETKIHRDKAEIRKKCEKAKDCKPKCDAKDKECTMCCKGDLCNKDQGYAEFKPWGQWSSCSKQCGGGKRSRSRECSNTGNLPCSGDTKEEQDCNKQACAPKVQRCYTCSYGKKNSDCTKIETCKQDEESCETKVKRDKAEIKMACRKTKDCKPKCVAHEKECTMCCTGDLCNKGQGYAEFKTWGQWSSCSKQCGGGKRSRSRECSNTGNRPCSGDTKEEQDCNKNACQTNVCVKDCKGVKNGDYQSCSTCNGFIKCSNHRLYNFKCPGSTVWDDKVKRCEWKSTTCNSQPALMRCYTCSYGKKNSDCTKIETCKQDEDTCETKIHRDKAEIRKKCEKAKDCKPKCDAKDKECTMCCKGDLCNKDQGYAEFKTWGQWSSCSKQCGGGKRSRSRECSNTGNLPCSGDTKEEQDCNKQACAPKVQRCYTCSYGKKNSDCTKIETCKQDEESCETKVKRDKAEIKMTCRKTKDCKPKCVAHEKECTMCCTGDLCNKGQGYAEFKTWGQWSSCSKQCGGGKRSRSRECSNTGNRPCSGDTKEEQDCNKNACQTNVCVKDCKGVKNGDYQSCSTCNGFIKCSNHRLYNFKCPGSTVWDDKVKRCEWKSTTCNSQPAVMRCYTCSYGKKNSDCTKIETCKQDEDTCETKIHRDKAEIRKKCEKAKDCKPKCDAKDKECTMCCKGDLCNKDQGYAEFKPWGQWSSCSKQCGGGKRSRSRECSNTGNRPCSGDTKEEQDCNKQACAPKVQRCYTCSYGKKNSDCTKIETCKQDEESCETKVKRDKAEIKMTCRKTKDCKPKCVAHEKECTMCCTGDLCNKGQGYAEFKTWGQWSSCSKQCGGGKRSRSRECSNTGNRPCSGDTKEEQDCNKNACQTNVCVKDCKGVKNGDYQSCSTCNGFIKCSNHRLYNFKCPGSTVWDDKVKRCEWKSTTCNSQPALMRCYTCSYGKKNSDCTKIETCKQDEDTCETKIHRDKAEIRKKCEKAKDCKPKCDAKDKECTMCCKGDLCNKDQGYAEFKTWGQWSSCSKQCGGGKRSRSRECSNTGNLPCSGDTKEEQDCNKQACAPKVQRCYTCSNGKKNSDCTKIETCKHDEDTCETKIRRDKGEIRKKCEKAKDCKPECDVKDKECTMCCKGDLCNKDQGYAEFKTWGQWSSCSKQCGGGKRSRSRECSNTGNLPCSGDTKEEQDCNKNACQTNVCVKDCKGVKNGDYQSCSTCNGFIKCSNHRLYNFKCPGSTVWDDKVKRCEWKSTTCNSQPALMRCYTCSYGKKNSDCTKIETCKQDEDTCETKIHRDKAEIRKKCEKAKDCKPKCDAKDKECTMCCKGDLCNKDQGYAEFKTWGQWSSCSKQCGGGKRSRSRECSNTGNLPCSGDTKEEQDCNKQACAPKVQRCYTCSNGKKNSDCTKIETCKQDEDTCETKIRRDKGEIRKKCEKAKDCKPECDVKDKECTMCCKGDLCNKDQGYAEFKTWGQWSSCSKQCGGGKRSRNRQCSNTGNLPCSGDTKEEQDCNKQSCASTPMKCFSCSFSSSNKECNKQRGAETCKKGQNICGTRLDRKTKRVMKTCASMCRPKCDSRTCTFCCNTPNCNEEYGTYSPWSKWEIETVKNVDQLKRKRSCTSGECSGNLVETKACTPALCKRSECFTCSNANSNEECNKKGGKRKCHSGQNTCFTRIDKRTKKIIKACTNVCKPVCDGRACTYCCNTPGCNSEYGTYGQWSPWKQETIKNVDVLVRRRKCSSEMCSGKKEETKPCSPTLCTSPAHRCHVCNKAKSNVECLKVEKCNKDEESCETKVYRSKTEISKKCKKTKDCNSKCDPKDDSCVTCCTGSLCNKDSGYAKWSTWGPWTSCNKQCGGGVQRRKRACSTTSMPCSGDQEDSKKCNTQRCSNVIQPATIPPNSLKSGCYICSHEKSSDACNAKGIQACPKGKEICGTRVDRKTKNVMKACTAVCKPGCNKNACTFCCSSTGCNKEFGKYGQWSSWKEKKTKGGKVLERKRDCTTTECSGVTVETKPCTPALCSGYTQQCNVCNKAKKNSECTKTETCKKDEDTCETRVEKNKAEITKRCRKEKDCKPKCDPKDSYCVTCCKGSLCNKDEAYGKYSLWSVWTACSKRCGGGKRSRTRKCSSTKLPCEGPSTEEQDCNTASCVQSSECQKCTGAKNNAECNKQNKEICSAYQSCETKIDRRTKALTKKCTPTSSCRTLCHGNSAVCTFCCQGDNCNEVYGEWAPWSAWALKNGKKTRIRSCNTIECSGDGTEEQTCTGTACSGVQKFQCRSCTNARSDAECNFGSFVTCPADQQTCQTKVVRGSGLITKGCAAPSSCTPSCTAGSRTCTFCCSGSQCNENFGSWGMWGSWSVTGPKGSLMTRKRTCTSIECSGETEETVKCQGPICSQFRCQACNNANSNDECNKQGFQTCSQDQDTCGTTVERATKRMSKGCKAKGACTPWCDAVSCTFCCKGAYCNDVYGVWQLWTSWKVVLENNVYIRQRTRDCATTECSGDGIEKEPCTGTMCTSTTKPAVDGGFTDWSSWTSCSKTCGTGIAERSRTCTQPVPENGGKNCTGGYAESKTCSTQPCAVDGTWGVWGPWAPCSKTCGGGKQHRERKCDDPAPAHGGSDCSGDSTQLDDCNTILCPLPSSGQYVQKCPRGWFTCKSGGITCIDESFKCDCSNDCDDGSDEEIAYASCTISQMQGCQSGTDHVKISWWVLLLTLAAVLVLR